MPNEYHSETFRKTIGKRLMERGTQAVGFGFVLIIGGWALDKLGV